MSKTKLLRTSLHLATCCLMLLASNGMLSAQGRSIPKGSEAKDKGAAKLIDELPEGQKYRYKMLNGLSFSVDLFQPVMNLFATDYASYEAQAMLDIHHRFFPMASFGMGFADAVSDNGLDYGTGQKQDIHFKSDLAPFGKIGLAYNLQYNDPDPSNYYLAFMRYGIAYNTADITNLYYPNSHWHDYGPLSITDQSYFSQWIEAGAMIKVSIGYRFSLGWDVYWKIMLHQSGNELGTPHFVPGYATDSSVGFAFRLYYDLF